MSLYFSVLAVLHKFHKQCYPNVLGNLGSLDSSIESGLTIIKRFRFYRNLLLFFEFRYYPYYYYYYYYYSFFYRTRDWNRKSPKPHHIQQPNSTHIWTLIRHTAARVSVLIRITVPDLEPNPCFQIFLNISETNYRIFNCNMSNRRSSQELPFIFFELRAPTCL